MIIPAKNYATQMGGVLLCPSKQLDLCERPPSGALDFADRNCTEASRASFSVSHPLARLLALPFMRSSSLVPLINFIVWLSYRK
jgi:hypothetical protein